MRLYQQELIKEGFSEGVAYGLATAFNRLHAVLCRLDKKNLDIFMTKQLSSRLHEFSKIEDLKKFPLID